MMKAERTKGNSDMEGGRGGGAGGGEEIVESYLNQEKGIQHELHKLCLVWYTTAQEKEGEFKG